MNRTGDHTWQGRVVMEEAQGATQLEAQLEAQEAEQPNFGAWVRERRKVLWLTQKKLARLVGCAPVTIQKIEEGRRRPSPPVAEALVTHLELAGDQREPFLRLARTMLVPLCTPTSLRGAAPASAASPGPLPLQPLLPPMIGRAEALAGLRRRLLAPSHRLLTLTGPPGVGKTRLALQVAAELHGAFVDGVWFVPLAGLDDPAQVLPTVGRRLGLLNGSVERLTAFLKGRNTLLVLDNFEHLLGAALPLAGVLEACPGLRVLVTSRAALRLSAEWEWPLEPLEQAVAVQMFAERVRAFDPAFDLNARTAAAVSEIVTRLDRLPLAIELAAVRLRYQSPEALADCLRDAPLSSLGSGPIDGPERQHTLDRAIAWSYERLEAPLQRVFRHLGVFVGGFEAVAAGPVTGAAPGDLEALLDVHLIRREGVRFGLLETLRAYALERLEAHQETDAARNAHQDYLLAAAQAHQGTDLDWFEAEVSNARAALRTQLESGQIEAALRLALTVYWFWETRGYQYEGLDYFRAILERSATLPPKLRLAGLNTGSTMAWQSGRIDLSRVWLTEGLSLSRQTNDLDWEAKLLMHQGKVELEEGQYAAAQRVLEPALVLARQLSLPWLIASVLYQMADGKMCLGELERAETLASEGMAICRDHPGLFWETPLLLLLGLVALERGQLPLARQQMLLALHLTSGTEHRLQLTLILTGLAAVSAAPGAGRAELMGAARLWSCVQVARDLSGYHWSVAFRERSSRWTTQARGRLSESDWNLAWAIGRDMTLPEAVLTVQNEAAVGASPQR